MQTQDPNPRTTGAVNHPGPEQWMAFLYGELPPATRTELGEHLAHCAACSDQLRTWRASMSALDQWKLPAHRPAVRGARVLIPALKWAAAAAVVLAVGFVLGRQSTTTAAQLAGLKASVASLEQRAQSDPAADRNAFVEAATAAANNETVRLLSEYSRAQDEQRVADRQEVSLALRAFGLRLANMQTDLETVAVNTQDGFLQTSENLAQ